MSKYGREVNKYLQRVQRGDRQQMAPLFELTANHLRAVANRYLSDKSYCDDVVSDAYCKVMKHIESFDPKKDGYNWMCKIVERTAYSYNEKSGATVDIDGIAALGTVDAGADDKIDILAAMENLPPQDREMVLDYFYLGLSYSEIAAKYGVVKSAAHKRIKKAFKLMKKYLEDG